MNFRPKVQSLPTHFTLINFIDILLVLTVFLMSNIALSPEESSTEVNLPKSSAEPKEQRQKSSPIVVNITKEGEYIMNSTKITEAVLRNKLEKLKELDPGSVVVIRADSEASYETVLHFIELCGDLKIDQISFASKKPGT